MDPECRNISKVILPAVRASIAEIMRNQYNYRQKEIAEKLGVVQVAVSKYLNKRYSDEIERIKRYITEHGLITGIVDDIVKGKPSEEIGREIDSLCGSVAEKMASGTSI